MQAIKSNWYIDLYISKFLINNKGLFVGELWPKSLAFTIADGQTVYVKSIDIIAILFVNRFSIKLKEVVYILK